MKNLSRRKLTVGGDFGREPEMGEDAADDLGGLPAWGSWPAAAVLYPLTQGKAHGSVLRETTPRQGG